MYQQQLELENTRRRRTNLELTNEKEDGELVGIICKGPDLRRVCAIRQCPLQFIPCAFFFFPYLTHTVGPETTSVLHISCTQGTDGKKERKKTLYQTGEMMRVSARTR